MTILYYGDKKAEVENAICFRKGYKGTVLEMYSRGNRNTAAYQSECQARYGGVDLLTAEKEKGRDGK